MKLLQTMTDREQTHVIEIFSQVFTPEQATELTELLTSQPMSKDDTFKRFEEVNKELTGIKLSVQKLEGKMDAKFLEMNAKFLETDKRQEKSFAFLDAKIDKVESKLMAQIVDVKNEVSNMRNDLKTIKNSIVLGCSILGALIALFAFIQHLIFK